MPQGLFLPNADLQRLSQHNENLYWRTCSQVALVIDNMHGTYVRNASKDKIARLFELAISARLHNVPLTRVVALHADAARTGRSKAEAKTALGCTLERLTDPDITSSVRRKLAQDSITVQTPNASHIGSSGIELAEQLAAHSEYAIDPVQAYQRLLQ